MDKEAINEQINEFFKAFSNLERLKIAGLLVNEALTPGQIAERLGIPIKETMNHLGYLTHWGYLKNLANTYQLDKEAWTTLSRQVLENVRPRSKAEDFEGEEFDRKVLKDFISADGKLIAIPTQNKKRLVVLRYLLKPFEPGVRYPEKQVNDLLRPYFADTASLRRYMVDEGFLQRENSIYWRTE